MQGIDVREEDYQRDPEPCDQVKGHSDPLKVQKSGFSTEQRDESLVLVADEIQAPLFSIASWSVFLRDKNAKMKIN